MNEVAQIRKETWPLSRIKVHPDVPGTVPKKGSKAWKLLEKSLDHDYFALLVVNERNEMLVDGRKRLAILKDRGVKEVDVSVVSYDEATHLARLLAPQEHFCAPAKDEIQALMDRLQSSPVDMALTCIMPKKAARPKPDTQPDLGEVYEIIVECGDEHQQKALYERFKQEGLKCRLLTL